MNTKLIRLKDDILVEVKIPEREAELVGFRDSIDEKLETSFNNLKKLLQNVVHPYKAAIKEIGKDMEIDSAELELGLSFEAEGNIYVANATTGANIVVKLSFKPPKV